MDYGRIDGIDKAISRLVLGTGFIQPGGDRGRYWEIMDAAFEAGITAIDSGREYADGYADECIGAWMSAAGTRDRITLVSKGCHHNRWRKRVTPFDLESDLRDTLAALRTDRLDVYLLHRDDESVPVGPMIEALNAHCEAGRIRTFGASNWDYPRVREANAYARERGLRGFSVLSQHFSLGVQRADPWGGGCVSLTGEGRRADREWHRAEAMPLLAYSSLCLGLFSGKVADRRELEAAIAEGRINAACDQAYGSDDNFERLRRASILAREKGVPLATLAAAYVLEYQKTGGFPTFALVGAENRLEAFSAARAAELRLGAEELAWLDLRSEEPGGPLAGD